jgi:hemolysin III
MPSPSAGPKIEPKFSVALFVVTVLITLAGLFGGLAFLAPGVWQSQLAASWGSLVAVFLAVHLFAALVEFVFHRYVLHAPLVPFLSYFYKQHTLHHALTRIDYQKSRDGRENIPRLVEGVAINRYPIMDEPQYEASYFPWYTLAVFALLGSFLFAPIQWLLPEAPVFLGGYLAIAWSLVLYELIHAMEHWPQAIWDRLIQQKRWGRFWRKAYAFHLRHHADIRCNEAISGFFALPLIDLAFGTYVDPETLYTHGRPVSPQEFVSPRPRLALVRWLDRQAESAVKRRRQRRAGGAPGPVAGAPANERIPTVGPKFAAALARRTES